ncbi:SRPBCC family protein [Streptomyces carpinensis]|uniref:SRPBCC family protein n=1 Tax=Streptomyces carpinensis TaxID=66369 RepID=A0ABV1VU96_9ACTN|nr:SRPBCC family protein [Streptomyces carpinensis]
MQLENTFTVPLPADQAWPVLLEVERVVACVPGATLDSVDGDDITARMRVKLGPIMMTYRGRARFVERDEAARRVVIEASGKDSKGAGTVSATVQASLYDHGNETEVRVVTVLKLTGKPAQFGRGAIQDVSSTLIDRFAQALSAEFTTSGPQGRTDSQGQTDSHQGGVSQTPTPVSNGSGVAAKLTAPAAPGTHLRAADDHLDLLDAVGPVARRIVPRVAGVALLIALLAFLGWYFTSN